jgi:enamine deaminase RidA (YjgF/YER057c/UK114 family)
VAKKASGKARAGSRGVEFFGSAAPYPISRAVRAGDFVITAGLADRVRTAEETVYDAEGMPLPTGKRRKETTFAEEVHGVFKSVEEALALAGCTLADVVDCQVWLKDPRDFHEMNRIYAEYFRTNRPVRSVFQNNFMFEFRIELKVVAYKPLDGG